MLKAKISGPLEGHEGFFLAKGKYRGQDWSGVVCQKEGHAMVVVHRAHASKVGKQKVVSYSGDGMLAESGKLKTGQNLEFGAEGTRLSLTLRAPREDSKSDLAQQLAEANDSLKKQAGMQEETLDLIEALQREVAELKAAKEEEK